MAPLCIVSFLGHADIFVGPEHSSERVSAETDMVSLDRKNKHPCVCFDSLTHSAFFGKTISVSEIPLLIICRMLASSLACNGESRKTHGNIFRDNEEFIRFGESLDN